MTVPSEIMHFRNERAQDLRRFADKLETFIGNGISTTLYKGVGQLKDSSYIPTFRNEVGQEINDDINYWGYSIDNIKLEVTTLEHIKPKGINKAEANINITIVSDYRNWNKIKDPFCELKFNVVIRAINPKNETGINYFGFHLDRHHESQISDKIHPVYHLQYNLNPKKEKNFDYGTTLHLDSPRFLHYPMDLILGLTYIIANFNPISYLKLIEDREIIKILKKYQEKIWKPYSFSISNQWRNNGLPIEWDQKSICPFLL